MMATKIEDHAGAPAKQQRIAKMMARAGLCSRRDAETWILAGRVTVNGAVLATPARDVGAEDIVLVDGAPLPAVERTRLFLFHKPRGLITSDHDPEGRTTVFDFLRRNWPEGPRVVSVGRLDINTEGLLLLTNDGGLARTLELPQTGWMRRYRVRAKGTADPAALDTLANGITIDGIAYAGIEAKLDRVQGANCWLTIGLREGKNREVKRVLEHLGLEVNRLIRVSFGPFQLLHLPDGAVEEVRTRTLRDQLGLSLAAQAGVSFDVPEGDLQHETRDAHQARRPRSSQTDAERPRRKTEANSTRRTTRTDKDPLQMPRRDKPAARARKHISTLRKAEHSATSGPRKRIERTATQDRRARAITVERLVTTDASGRAEHRDKPSRPSRRGGTARPRDNAQLDEMAHRSPGRDRTRQNEDGRRRESPSAEGKRRRKAQSGGSRADPHAHRSKSSNAGGRRSASRNASGRPNSTSPRPPRGRSKPKR